MTTPNEGLTPLWNTIPQRFVIEGLSDEGRKTLYMVDVKEGEKSGLAGAQANEPVLGGDDEVKLAPKESSVPDLREIIEKFPFRDGSELLRHLRFDLLSDHISHDFWVGDNLE